MICNDTRVSMEPISIIVNIGFDENEPFPAID